jgi:hypothetical protein
MMIAWSGSQFTIHMWGPTLYMGITGLLTLEVARRGAKIIRESQGGRCAQRLLVDLRGCAILMGADSWRVYQDEAREYPHLRMPVGIMMLDIQAPAIEAHCDAMAERGRRRESFLESELDLAAKWAGVPRWRLELGDGVLSRRDMQHLEPPPAFLGR